MFSVIRCSSTILKCRLEDITNISRRKAGWAIRERLHRPQKRVTIKEIFSIGRLPSGKGTAERMKFFSRLSEKKAKTMTFLLLSLAVVLLVAALLMNLLSPSGYSVTTYSMGSYVQQTVYGSGREDAAASAAGTVAQLENLISWRVEDSDVQKLNANAGKEFLTLDAATVSVLKTALSVCEESEGALDITVAPLSQLWDFDENPHLPDAALIDLLLPHVDYTQLSLPEDGTAALQKSGMAVDLGAVGKGAACDAAVGAYRESGVSRAVVAVGGSVGVYGEKPFGEAWKIKVRDPRQEGYLGELAIHSGFISTSGSYEKQFTQDGKTYHHILDPKTGYPAQSELVSVTVWSEGGALSDALSTACFVLGMEESRALLSAFNAGAVFVTQENKIYVTENLSDSFALDSETYRLAGTL